MNKQTLRDISVTNKRVLVRVDFNVPLNGTRISDDTRICAALPTIQYLLDHDAKVILMSHLGRPKGVDESLRLMPVAVQLSKLLGQIVYATNDCIGDEAGRVVSALNPREVMLLENLRFHKEEEKNDAAFAAKLAAHGEVYVNDAFGTAHRAHASTEGVAHHLPAVAGLLMEKELNFLGSAMSNPARPFVAILGGAKVSDKIAVITSLLQKADYVLIGGGMANTFAKCYGYEVGDSLVAPAVPIPERGREAPRERRGDPRRHRHGDEGRLQLPDGAARAARPGRPRHQPLDPRGAAGRVRRPGRTARPDARGARRGREARPQERRRLLRLRQEVGPSHRRQWWHERA